MVAIGLFVFFMVLLSIFALSFKAQDKQDKNKQKAITVMETKKVEIINELTAMNISPESNCSLMDEPTGLGIILPNTQNKEVFLDENKELIIFVDYFSKEYLIIPFKDLVDCEIIENNDVLKKTSIKGAIAGAVIAGEAGAIIGSTMGKNLHTVKSLQIRIITANLKNPLIIIDLIKYETQKNTPMYARIFEFANRVYAVCTAIIDRKVKTA